MADLFFYGTLCHVPLLERVLGRPAAEIALSPAVLPGWAVYWAAGECFPTIRAEARGRAEGLLLLDLDEEALARLDHYEGGFGYALEPLEVTTPEGACQALVYLPEGARWPAGAPWRLADWVARFGPLTLAAADEVMERFGVTTPQDRPAVSLDPGARLGAMPGAGGGADDGAPGAGAGRLPDRSDAAGL